MSVILSLGGTAMGGGGGGGVELRAQAEPWVRVSVEDSMPSLFTINHQDLMGRRICSTTPEVS